MRYKDGKGDPRGFTVFLETEGLPRGLLPRYRGNCLHVLFHIFGKLIAHHNVFMKYLDGGRGFGGLRASLSTDFKSETAHVELQVLGLIGKYLTEPWMNQFYTSKDKQLIEHVEAIGVVKKVMEEKKEKKDSVADLLKCTVDFLGLSWRMTLFLSN